MRFLIANIRKEDILLEYPWLEAFHPEFHWREGHIHDSHLPIEISSIYPQFHKDPVIAALQTEEKLHIISQLEDNCQV